jgi:hypothetical protein
MAPPPPLAEDFKAGATPTAETVLQLVGSMRGNTGFLGFAL